MTQHHILIVGNEGLSRGAIRNHLETQGFRVEEARTGNIARQLLSRDAFDVVLIDDRPESVGEPSGAESDDCLRSGRPVLYWTHLQGGAEAETPALNLDLLSAEIERVIEMNELSATLARLQRRFGNAVEPRPLLGESAAMRNLISLVGRICDGADTPVLLEGEDGVGKRTLAETIHRGSRRGDQLILTVACRGRAPSELERILFGNDDTSGAAADPGVIADAQGGTLYLRDIDALPLELQERLARHFRPMPVNGTLGKTAQQPPRLIACTRYRLTDRVARGQFREDLLRLLQVGSLTVPPLRERRGDIRILADYFLKRAAQESGQPSESFSPDAQVALGLYDWPGNVAELRNVVDRLIWTSGKRVLEKTDLPAEIARTADPHPASSDFQVPLGEMTLEEMEVRTLRAALDRTGHNQVRAAQLLGVSRDTLRYRMKKFGLLSRRQRGSHGEEAYVDA